MRLPTKPEHLNNLEFIRNLTPYVFSAQLVKGKSVLDVGCSFGHGAWLLVACGAERLTAVDLDRQRLGVAHDVLRNMQDSSLLAMNAQRLAFKDQSFQVATCFEVIEHVENPADFLSEVRRILTNQGILLLTTPNRSVRLFSLQRPWNPEHLREYTLDGLGRALQQHFSSFVILGIYGEAALHEYYIRLWRKNPLRAYVRELIPTPVRRWIRNQLGVIYPPRCAGSDPEFLNPAIPSPDPENWPFYVSDATDGCLNFLAVCASDAGVVQTVVTEVKQSRTERGFS